MYLFYSNKYFDRCHANINLRALKSKTEVKLIYHIQATIEFLYDLTKRKKISRLYIVRTYTISSIRVCSVAVFKSVTFCSL